MTTKEPSISDLLAARGFSHRPTKECYGAREVYHVESGERLGIMTAAEAVEFLESQS